MNNLDFKTKEDVQTHQKIIHGLWDMYSSCMQPLETATNYQTYYSSTFTEGELKSPPLVLLVGPYSAGKTTFIRNLVGQDFMGQRIGPEPTTDKFVAIMHGEENRIIPGNALTVAPNSPFGGCNNFGNGFLTRFEGSMMNCDILKRITLVDTPGILSGKKQRNSRSYNYDAVLSWFAERADMIILLLDPFKVDISDEMAAVIQILQANGDKVRVALNKSDMVSQQQLMRVYGALMWNLGKVMGTPEVCRVYFGSFWEHPPANPETEGLLNAEMQDLMSDLWRLPRLSAVRLVNDIVKRTRRLRVHCYVLDYLRAEMPRFMGQDKKKQELCDNMPEVFQIVARKYNLPISDFPDVAHFVSILREFDFTQFPALVGARLKGGKLMEEMEHGVQHTIPELLQNIPCIGNSEPPQIMHQQQQLRDQNKESTQQRPPPQLGVESLLIEDRSCGSDI